MKKEVSHLEEVSRYYTYSCSVCGKNTQVENGSIEDDGSTSAELHFSGCVRKGLKWLW